jgi:hypothetical protein
MKCNTQILVLNIILHLKGMRNFQGMAGFGTGRGIHKMRPKYLDMPARKKVLKNTGTLQGHRSRLEAECGTI